MINKVQNTFKIHDLELLSGIKAHTIRIWEKRYGLFTPTRLERNIRTYTISDVQKILNVSLLQKHDYKISELSKLSDTQIANKVSSISEYNFKSDSYINSFLVSMLTYNEELFEKTYSSQVKSLHFRDVFKDTFVPLLYHIGNLWQTNTINPSHEHFITNLIYQKILLNIATLPKSQKSSENVNILYLPEGEVHELGLLYLLFHLKSIGENTIYLGRDIPLTDLISLNSQFETINWICSFTVNRSEEEKVNFLKQAENLLRDTNNSYIIVGKIWDNYTINSTNMNIKFYIGFEQLI